MYIYHVTKISYHLRRYSMLCIAPGHLYLTIQQNQNIDSALDQILFKVQNKN